MTDKSCKTCCNYSQQSWAKHDNHQLGYCYAQPSHVYIVRNNGSDYRTIQRFEKQLVREDDTCALHGFDNSK